jgi:hypothetical protein
MATAEAGQMVASIEIAARPDGAGGALANTGAKQLRRRSRDHLGVDNKDELGGDKHGGDQAVSTGVTDTH